MSIFRLAVIAVFILVLSTAAYSQQSNPKPPSTIQKEFSLGYNIGYLSAVRDSYNGSDICAKKVTMLQWAKALQRFVQDNPGNTQLSPEKALTVLKREFPCEQKEGTYYDDGYKAFERKDYASALTNFKAAADAGDVRGDHALGNLYLQGLGIEKDLSEALRRYEKAAQAGNVVSVNMLAALYLGERGIERNLPKSREWARRSARAGNAEGAYILSRALVEDPELQYIENGKANRDKYFKLAKRPVSERQLEIEGLDMLARAARLGHPSARLALAGFYIDKPGDNNRKALAILQATPALPPMLEKFKSALLELQALGATFATVKLVRDAQMVAISVAAVRAGLRDKEKSVQCHADKIKLIRMIVSKPIESAEYLPLSEQGMEKAYLMRGVWEETWTYDVCGMEVNTPITFQADGFGGASFHASGK